MKLQSFLFISVAHIFLPFCVEFSGQLNCCIGPTELKTQDEPEGPFRPCTNTGTKCSDVGCEQSKCLPAKHTDPETAETFCKKSMSCPSSMVDPLCRLYYYEDRSANAPPPRPTHEDYESEPVDFQYVENWAMQECVDNKDKEVLVGCDFYQKIFYQSKARRIILQKDCYCNANNCNENISFVCTHIDDKIKTVKDTCGANRIRWGGVPLVGLLVFLCGWLL